MLHEFGHMLGLDHEWLRQNLPGGTTTCSATTDPFSVMNAISVKEQRGFEGRSSVHIHYGRVLARRYRMDATSVQGDGNVSGTVSALPCGNYCHAVSFNFCAVHFKTVGQSSFSRSISRRLLRAVDNRRCLRLLLPTLSTPAPKRLSTLFIVIMNMSSIVGVGIMSAIALFDVSWSWAEVRNNYKNCIKMYLIKFIIKINYGLARVSNNGRLICSKSSNNLILSF